MARAYTQPAIAYTAKPYTSRFRVTTAGLLHSRRCCERPMIGGMARPWSTRSRTGQHPASLASSTIRLYVRSTRFSKVSTQDGNRLKTIRGPDRSYGLFTIGRLDERISVHGAHVDGHGRAEQLRVDPCQQGPLAQPDQRVLRPTTA